MLVKLAGAELLHVQIYRALRAAILRGSQAPGSRLPSTRSLALDAGVARNTVLRAYDQLLGEGYAVVRRGSGTYVANELPDDMIAAPGEDVPASAARPVVAPRLSRLGRTIQRWEVNFERGPGDLAHDFRFARAVVSDFPMATWRRLLMRHAGSTSEREIGYGPAAGVPVLREAIVDYLRRSRGLVGDADQVLIVNGAQQALDLVARVLLEPDDRVVMEEPQYAAARGVFVAAGASVVTLPVDAEGLNLATLDRGMRRIRLAYVTPSHQFPTGVVMSLARRLTLLSWAVRKGIHVVEDDYDSEYRYSGRPIESLQGLDRSGRVIYVGTFSKLLFPALRLGYLVLPRPLLKPFLNAKALADTGTAPLEQLVLADFIREGHFERHIRRSRARHAARRSALVQAIRVHLGDRVEISGDSAGTYVLLWLNDVPFRRLDSCIARAREAGIGIYSAAPFFSKRPARAALLLSYTALTDTQIHTAIRRLATVLA